MCSATQYCVDLLVRFIHKGNIFSEEKTFENVICKKSVILFRYSCFIYMYFLVVLHVKYM